MIQGSYYIYGAGVGSSWRTLTGLFRGGGEDKGRVGCDKKEKTPMYVRTCLVSLRRGFGQETATVRAQATKSTWILSNIKRDKSVTFGTRDWSLERFFKEVPISPVIGF
ncbi:unnamed protein product [Ectocarpus sp. 8 AP-2014]